MDLWELWLLTAAAVHLGFQATVTSLVYPALVARGRRGDADWAVVHAEHSRRITPLVVLVYGGLLVAVLASLWHLVTEEVTWAPVVAVTGAGVAFGATAVAAAPAHGRLARGWSPRVARRLVLADLVRLAGAVTCVVGALGVSR